MVFGFIFDIINGIIGNRNQSGPVQEEFDEKLSKDLKYKTDSGHMVQSKGELEIANRLWSLEIPYIYNQKIEINGKWLRPDFILPEHNNLIVEFVGMGSQEYNERLARKLEILENAQLQYILIRSGDLSKLDKFFV